jgi:hypothetical protein
VTTTPPPAAPPLLLPPSAVLGVSAETDGDAGAGAGATTTMRLPSPSSRMTPCSTSCRTGIFTFSRGLLFCKTAAAVAAAAAALGVTHITSPSVPLPVRCVVLSMPVSDRRTSWSAAAAVMAGCRLRSAAECSIWRTVSWRGPTCWEMVCRKGQNHGPTTKYQPSSQADASSLWVACLHMVV